jgi:phage FluMu gp28-like protein
MVKRNTSPAAEARRPPGTSGERGGLAGPHAGANAGSIPAGRAIPETPHLLLSYQREWVTDQSDVALWEKSRRIGASWCDACDSVLTASPEQDPMDALYIGYSEDMTREYIEDCAMWARAFSLAAGEVQEEMFVEEDEHGDKNSIKAFRIDFASGKKIQALSSRPRSIRGKQGKVTIDEAAFHDDLAGLMKAALAMLIWGGRVRILSSHNGEDNPFNLLLKDVRAGKLPYAIHSTTFTQALDAGLYDRVKLMMGKRLKEQTRAEWEAKVRGQYGEDAAEELDCIPRQGAGVYIPRTIVERCQRDGCTVLHLVKPAEWMLNDRRLEEADRWIADVLKPAVDSLPNIRSVLGRDFGRSGDLSIEGVLQETENGRWRATLTIELRRIPFDVQQKINFFLLDNLPLFHHAKYDARGNGQQLAEAALQKHGPARIECVMATPAWYAANFPPYKAALEDQSCELPKGEDEIADHRRVILKNGYPAMDEGKDKGSDGEQRHGDRAVARVLAWAATRTEGQPPAGESIDRDAGDMLPPGMENRRRMTVFRRAA